MMQTTYVDVTASSLDDAWSAPRVVLTYFAARYPDGSGAFGVSSARWPARMLGSAPTYGDACESARTLADSAAEVCGGTVSVHADR